MVGSLAHARGRQGFRRLQSHSPPVLECTEADFLAAVAELKVRVGMCMLNITEVISSISACSDRIPANCPLESNILNVFVLLNALK